MLTDVEGLYRDWPNSDDVIRRDQPRGARRDAADACDAGMVPKMRRLPARPCRAACPRATVVDGREPHAVLLELFTDEGVGTQVLPGVETKTRKATRTARGR